MDGKQRLKICNDAIRGHRLKAFHTGAVSATVVDDLENPCPLRFLCGIKLPEAVWMLSLPFDPMNAFVLDFAPPTIAVGFDNITICALGEIEREDFF